MIPRKLARRLLAEHTKAIIAEIDPHVLPAGLEDIAKGVERESDLVLRGAENVEQKARRYLEEGRIAIVRMEPNGGAIVATCRGSAGAVYSLGYDPRGGGSWRCTCPQPGRRKRCSHLVALQLVATPTLPDQ